MCAIYWGCLLNIGDSVCKYKKCLSIKTVWIHTLSADHSISETS